MESGILQGALGAQMSQIAAARQETQFNALANERGSAANGGETRVPRDAGKHFEAMLATMLAKELRSGLDEGFFGSGPGADTFSAWLDEHIGRVMAERGTLGMAELVNRFAADVEDAGAPGSTDGGAE